MKPKNLNWYNLWKSRIGDEDPATYANQALYEVALSQSARPYSVGGAVLGFGLGSIPLILSLLRRRAPKVNPEVAANMAKSLEAAEAVSKAVGKTDWGKKLFKYFLLSTLPAGGAVGGYFGGRWLGKSLKEDEIPVPKNISDRERLLRMFEPDVVRDFDVLVAHLATKYRGKRAVNKAFDRLVNAQLKELTRKDSMISPEYRDRKDIEKFKELMRRNIYHTLKGDWFWYENLED